MAKKKKLTPEEILAQFKAWQQSPEYEFLERLRQLASDLPEIMEVTPDLMGKWQPFLDEFVKIPAVCKIKGAALKGLAQEQLRTTFFGGVNKRDEPFEIDGFPLDFPNKEVPKNCRHIKNNFVEMLKHLEELGELDETTYAAWKQNKIVYKYKEFAKFMKEHVKKDKGHTEAKKLLTTVLAPLKELMEATLRLSVFEVRNCSRRALEENYFQYRALIVSFAEKYQPCQTLVFKSRPELLKANPDIYSVLKKLDYVDWEANAFERSYIFPLQESFNRLKANLIKLHSLGFDAWKQPIADNGKFLADLAEMVDKEETAEYLLGGILPRAQTNFIYGTCLHLYHSKARDSLLHKDAKLLEKTLPQLIVLRSMVRANKIFEARRRDAAEGRLPDENADSGASKKLEFELMSAKAKTAPISRESLIPKSVVYTERFRSVQAGESESVYDDNDAANIKQYGKLFLWSNMLAEEDHLPFIQRARTLRDINQAILNDLEDFYIMEGLKPQGADYISDRASAISKMNMLNERIDEEVRAGLPETRPPHLWNEPQSLKEEHKIRFSTNIFNETTYKQIKELYLYIEATAGKLRGFDEGRWNRYIDAVVTSLINHDKE